MARDIRGFRWLVVLALTSVVGCALLQQGTAPPKKEVVEEDEDAGVEAIGRMLRDARKLIAKKRFEDATRLVVRSERAVKKASETTRAHPDFEDKVQAVVRMRTKLEGAIEQDRIERREAIMDELIRKAEVALRQGSTLFEELKVRFPASEDIEALTEIVETLFKVRADGAEYINEARYKAHADRRDEQATILSDRLAQARWQRKVAKEVGGHIEEAHKAAAAVKGAEATSERILAFQKAASAFTACVDTLTSSEDAEEYDASRLIETRLGTHPIVKTKRLCAERSGIARKEGYKLDWHDKVLEVVSSLAGPVAKTRAGGSATEALEASEDALNALSVCQSSLDKMGRHPGVEARKVFDTALGKLTANQLEQACAIERGRLSRSQGSLKWRAGVEEIAARLRETKTRMDQAHLAKDPDERIKRWSGVISGLNECINDAREAARARGAERGFAVVTVFGKLNVGGIEAECKRQLTPANEQHQRATQEAELAKFVLTCRGDEVAVAQREGIPTSIQNVDGGRIFVYQRGKGKKAEKATFGFDTTGKRVDFRLRWLNHVGNVVAEVNRALQAIAGAPNGEEALAATEASLPVLVNCKKALEHSDRDPGYDGKAVFTTALGKVPAGKLAELCASERVRRAGTIVGLKWRIRLEELRDRVGEANTELERGKAAPDAATRSEKVGAAVGGFNECVERADSLGKADGADAKLKVKTAFGDLNLRGILKTCQSMIKTAQKDLDAALADKARDDFVSSCKGDEAEVARRRGIPTRIEEKDEGRVFVYETGSGRKKKSKRFAFNSEGKRVDEKTLRAGKSKGKKK